MERSLAHIEQITNIRPIDGCDNICLCNVLGWSLIIKKDEFKDGDKCVYIEIDSIAPSDMECFSFLEKKHYKIKTMKMRGVISQGLALPLSILPPKEYNIGDDVTQILRIKKIEDEVTEFKPINKEMIFKQKHKKLATNKFVKYFMKYNWFRNIMFRFFVPKKKKNKFPAYVVKTEENRIQGCAYILEKYKDIPMQCHEKIDGSSTTFALERLGKKKFDFAVCSRNVRQESENRKCFYDSNVYWEIAFKYNVEDVLKDLIQGHNTVVLQGETIGEGIQKNKYNIKGVDFYAFNLIFDGKKIDSLEGKKILEKYGIKWVPIVEENFKLLPTVDEMIAFADGKSKIYDTLREGLVIRDSANTVSFKCISNKFLIKHDL